VALCSVGLLLGSYWLAHRLFTPRPQPVTAAQALARARASFASRAPLALPRFGVSGTVRDTDAQPIAGASVCAACANCEGTTAPPSPCTQSDAQGRYALDRLAPGGYFVTASAPGFLPGSPSGGRPIFVEDAARGALDIALARGGAELAGVVLDATGGPVSHAHVRAIRMARARIALDAYSDDLGRFAFHVSDGPLLLVADADGYAPARASYVAPNTAAKLVLVPGATIAGDVVTAEDGAPVPGVTVHAIPAFAHGAGLSQTAQSDARGRFAIQRLEPGAYTLIARADHFVGDHAQPIALDLGETAEVRVALSAATEVTGRVVADDGAAPCRQGFVTLGAPDPTLPLPDAIDQAGRPFAAPEGVGPGPHQFAQIEADGSVRFPGVPSGYYFVTVQCVGHVLRAGPRVIHVAHEAAISDLRWDVAAGATLAIAVVDASRQPVPGARVEVRWPAFEDGRPVPNVPVVADAAGRVEIPGVLPGRYEVQAQGGPEAAEPVIAEVRRAGKTEVTLALRGAGAIEVELKTERGEAVEDMRLVALRVARDGAAADAGAALSPVDAGVTPLGGGRYRIGPLVEGRYVVRAEDGVSPPVQSGDGTRSFVQLGARGVARVSLRVSRGGAIRGRVIDEHGDPLPDVWVGARQAQDATPSLLAASSRFGGGAQRVLTDTEGAFAIDGLAAQDVQYTLHARSAHGGTARREGVRAGETVELTLATAPAPELQASTAPEQEVGFGR
jgi:protocatechuate 3,4-dioxygenase beta subunit